MKYAGFIITAVIALSPLSAFAAITYNPDEPQVAADTINYSCDTGDMFMWFGPDGIDHAGAAGCTGTSAVNSRDVQNGGMGIDEVDTGVECLSTLSLNGCDAATLSDAEADPGFISERSYQFLVSLPPPTGGDVSDFIATAKTDFNNQLGFSLDSVITWMSGLLLLFIGSGLAVLDAMKVWIVALIAIGVVIFFVFKGLRFFGASR